MNGFNKIPHILAVERTPLVDQLIDLVKERDDYISKLEEEIKRLKKLPQKSSLTPSKIKKGDNYPSKGIRRPGSDKAKKTEKLVIHETQIMQLRNIPPGAVFKGYRHFTVQDMKVNMVNTLFRCERYRTKEGVYIQARLPLEYQNEHFGPTLRTYILHQYHHQGVTQPLLLKQLQEWNIAISKGQLNRLINNKNAFFHEEKEKIFEAGIFLSAYLQTDDTGARHQGRNGYCTYIGNDLFAYFNSTNSKSRLNFIECLQGKMQGYKLGAGIFNYLKPSAATLKLLSTLRSVASSPYFFSTKENLTLFLKQIEITRPQEIKNCVEAAAFNYLRSTRLSKDIILISDEAGQFQLPTIKQSLCWLHVERKLKKLIPYTPDETNLLEKKTEEFWQFYQDLIDYKKNPLFERRAFLEKQFTNLCEPVMHYTGLYEVLTRIKKWQ